MSGGPANRAFTRRIPDPVLRTEVNTGVTPDCPQTEDSDRMSSKNSEVESAMNHQRWRAALRDPGFLDEAFNAFNSGDAYIRAAQDGLDRAMDQYLKDIRVNIKI